MAPARGSLSRRLALAFAAVAAITALLAAVILANVWNRQFDTYVREGMQETADGASHLLASSFIECGNCWTTDSFSQLPRLGMMSGLGLQVQTADGGIIYDDIVPRPLHARRYGRAGGRIPAARGTGRHIPCCRWR